MQTDRTKFTQDLCEKQDERDERRFKVPGSMFLELRTRNFELLIVPVALDLPVTRLRSRQDSTDGRSLDAPDIAPLFRHRNQ